MKFDDKKELILRALGNKTRPYSWADVAIATKLSKAAADGPLRALVRSGRVRERWFGDRGPFYEIAGEPCSR